jgi:hypothetical protein
MPVLQGESQGLAARAARLGDNAGPEPRPEAGAQRTLEGVGFRPSLGGGSASELESPSGPSRSPRPTHRTTSL